MIHSLRVYLLQVKPVILQISVYLLILYQVYVHDKEPQTQRKNFWKGDNSNQSG